MLQDFVGDPARIFTALLAQDERGVCLVIAKARIGRLGQLTDIGKAGFSQRVSQSLGENFLERFHTELWQRSMTVGRNNAALTERRYSYFDPEFWKIDRISSVDFALASLSRVLRSFRNLAIEARVRRWVWNWFFGTMNSTTNFTGALSSASNSMPLVDRPKAATTFSIRSEEQCGIAIPKPMPVLIVSSRCFSEPRTLSRSSALILPRLTSKSISSTIAGQRSVAFISGMICSEESKLPNDMQSARFGSASLPGAVTLTS